jgi:hypothetical protein
VDYRAHASSIAAEVRKLYEIIAAEIEKYSADGFTR